MELQRNTHHVFRIMSPFVWIPKYRHKVFEAPYRIKLKEIIRKIGQERIALLYHYQILCSNSELIVKCILKMYHFFLFLSSFLHLRGLKMHH